MKKIALILLTLVMVLSAAGCGASSEPAATADSDASGEEQASSEGKKYKIGINNFGQANFFARIGKESMEDEIKKLGHEVVATVTADVAARSSAVENMVAQGCDAIIIQEGDINEIAPAMKEAKDKGIVIGSMDAGEADFVDIYVASDNTALGKGVAEELFKAIDGKGNIVEIYNDAGSMIRMRKDAMHALLEDYPDINIASGIVYAWPDFFPDVKSKMESLLQANPNPGDIVGVFSCFDGGALASVDAIREAGLEEHIFVVGVDGDPDAYAEMKKPGSPFIATMAQDPDTMARVSVRTVIDILDGNPPESKIEHIPGILITKDNIPEVE